jgi:hypothetical protein
VIGADREAMRRVLVRDGLTRFRDPGRWTVGVVPVVHCFLDSRHEVRGGVEAEGDGIADVQIVNLFTRCLNPLRLADDAADGVLKPVHPIGGRNGGCGFRGRHLRIVP